MPHPVKGRPAKKGHSGDRDPRVKTGQQDNKMHPAKKAHRKVREPHANRMNHAVREHQPKNGDRKASVKKENRVKEVNPGIREHRPHPAGKEHPHRTNHQKPMRHRAEPPVNADRVRRN